MKGQRNDIAPERRGTRGLHQVAHEDFVRFWDKVDYTDDGSKCWTWKASVHRSGYGQFSIGHKKIMAHRFSYWASAGVDPTGRAVCHTCDNKLCVNPKHLWLGSQKDNMLDAKAKRRTQVGTKHWNAKLTESDIVKIRELRQMGATQREIAARFNIRQMHVSRILRGERWQ